MIEFERTQDMEKVREILVSPRIWPFFADDFAPSPGDFRPNDDSRIWYVLAREGDRFLGVFMFIPQSKILWEAHVAMLPSAWGGAARRAWKEVIPWLFEHTDCERLIAEIAEYNRPALSFAQVAGMEQYGRNPRSVAWHGKMWDLVLFGLSRGLERSAWR